AGGAALRVQLDPATRRGRRSGHGTKPQGRPVKPWRGQVILTHNPAIMPPGTTLADRSVTLTLGGGTAVGRLGFGAMRITGRGIGGPPPDEGAAIALLRHVAGKGVTFIDTADSYGPGVSETLIAKALYPYPAGLAIAGKGGMTRSGPGAWGVDCRPEHLRRACAESLRRLRLERIELYQLHAVDHRVPIED